MKLSFKKWMALILAMLYGLLIAAGGMVWTFAVYADEEQEIITTQVEGRFDSSFFILPSFRMKKFFGGQIGERVVGAKKNKKFFPEYTRPYNEYIKAFYTLHFLAKKMQSIKALKRQKKHAFFLYPVKKQYFFIFKKSQKSSNCRDFRTLKKFFLQNRKISVDKWILLCYSIGAVARTDRQKYIFQRGLYL